MGLGRRVWKWDTRMGTRKKAIGRGAEPRGTHVRGREPRGAGSGSAATPLQPGFISPLRKAAHFGSCWEETSAREPLQRAGRRGSCADPPAARRRSCAEGSEEQLEQAAPGQQNGGGPARPGRALGDVSWAPRRPIPAGSSALRPLKQGKRGPSSEHGPACGGQVK